VRGVPEEVGMMWHIYHPGGTSRFKIMKTADGTLGLEAAR